MSDPAKTCGTCRHRGAEFTDDEWGEPPRRTGFFLCERIKMFDKIQIRKWPAGVGACVQDGSGYYAALCVEADFGCNRWEAK